MPDDPTAPDLPLHGAGPAEAYARFWRRYALFTGRAGRSEYWWSVLGNALVALGLDLLSVGLIAVGAALRGQADGAAIVLTSLGAVLGFLLLLFALATVVPTIAIAVRRLHDADLSGLLVLLALIPVVGGLILVVLHCLASAAAGRRFDRGAPPTGRPAERPAPAAPPVRAAPAPAPAPAARSIASFETWPAPGPGVGAPATAPLATVPADPAPGSVRDALRSAWSRVGTVEELHPKLSSQPSWRRHQYLRVILQGGVGVLATEGLSEDTEGIAALGPGAEVYLGSTGTAAAPLEHAEGWELAIVAGVARRVGASGMNLPSELEQHGALSMGLTVAAAPAGWTAPDGTVGVLIGVGHPGVPESVVTPQGEVRLVGLAVLHPEELARILEGGGAARAEIAARLARLPVAELVSPDRPLV